MFASLQDVALETAELRDGLLDVEKERQDLRQQRRLAKIKLTKRAPTCLEGTSYECHAGAVSLA